MRIKITDIKSGAVVYHGDDIVSARYISSLYDSHHEGWEAELRFDNVKSEQPGLDELNELQLLTREEAIKVVHGECRALDADGDVLACDCAPNGRCTMWQNCGRYSSCQNVAIADDLSCMINHEDACRKAREYHEIFTTNDSDEEPAKMTKEQFLEYLRKEASVISPEDGLLHMCNIKEKPVTIHTYCGDGEDFMPKSRYCDYCPLHNACSQQATAYWYYALTFLAYGDWIEEALKATNVELVED